VTGINKRKLLHQIRHFATDMRLRFEVKAAQRRMMSKIEVKFCPFGPL